MRKNIENERDAILIWIIRWLKELSPDNEKYYITCIQAKFGNIDARRLYEVWEGEVFPASNKKAYALFSRLFPKSTEKVDVNFHRRGKKVVNKDQLNLFDDAA